MSSKGKGKAKEVFTGKRKSSGGGEERRRKRKNPGVLQFFEDAADVDESGSSDSEDIDNYFMEEEIDLNLNNEPGKTSAFPFVPKEEVIEEEFDRMMEERYKDGAGFVTYTEDSYEAKGSIDRNSDVPSSKDPTIWKVKCVVGRERHSAFCLMQKFIDMKSLGNKLQIISSFSVDNIKGFFYIEAERECDINEACKGLTYIYSSRVAPVPSNEVYHLLSVRPIRSEISVGMWARVKNGKYKGDLAQVVAVNNARKRATVKLIPRIDLQAMAAKFGGGVSIKRNVTVAPKLISSSELEEFRPLIQYRRDRESGIGFQVLDGMLLKDGYLYKKVSIDSLSCWSVMPTEEELLKFSHSENNETEEVEWLAQLYGEKKKKKTSKMDKGGEKGDGSSGFDLENSFELHDLVCFSRKDFGLIVGIEKDNRYKILKEASEGPAVVTVEQKELKSGPLDTKFTALDRHSKTISINDTVKVLEGQHEGKQGLVKQIYRGTVFLYDENETDNGGFFCCKSQMCEKIKQIFDACSGKDGGPSSSGFEVFDSSPKSPLSPEKPWEEKESRSDFKKGSGDGMFSIGQILRIRVGPLKGYLCRVLAVHYAECTVKVDSARKVLTVKNEHIAEVQGKSYATNKSENDGSSSLKPFDLGIGGSSGDWLDGAGTSAGGSGWNTESNSWPSFSGSGTSLQVEPNRSNTFGSGDSDMKKDGEDTAWDRKATSNQNSSWGTSFASENNDKETDGVSNAWENKGNANNNSSWGTSGDQAGNWNNNDKAAPKADSWAGASDAWGKAITSIEDPSGASKDAGGSWGQAKPNTGNPADSNPLENWGKRDASGSEDNSWGKAAGKWSNKDDAGGSNGNWGSSKLAAENAQGGWGSEGGCLAKAEVNADESSGWKKSNNDFGNQTKNWGSGKDTSECATGWTKGGSQNQSDGWNKSKSDDGRPSWGKHDGGSSWTKQLGGYSSGEQHLVDAENDSKGWKNPNDGWNKPSSGSGPGSGGWDQRNMENKDGKAQDSSWGKKSSFGAGTVDSGLDSGWGQKSNWNSGSGDAKQDSGWGKKSNLNSGSEDTNQDSGWGKKSNWNSGSGDTNQDSGWGKKSNQNSGSGDTNQDSGWGKKSNWNSGSGETNQDSGWGKKSNRNSGSGDTNQDSGWGKKSNGNSGSGDTNQDSGWGKKSNQNSGSGDTNQDSGWGKKSNWNSGSGDTNQDSGWGKKSNWNSGSGDTNQDSGWSKKSDWNSGSGNEDDNRGSGGSWRGGFGGRDGSGGGFRGRGNSDRGGFRGRGRSDRGGYGGRGRSDGGGFGGEGGRFGGRSEGGRFGGRSGEGGRFRGRGGERGGYGGRGRGRRDQNGDWNNGGDSGDNKPFSWKQDANNEGWKSSEVKWQGWSSTTGSGDGAKTWNQSDADQGGQSSGWNRANTDHGVQSSGWKQSNDDQGGKFSGWKQSNNDQGGQSSDWNQSKGGWNKGSGTTNETGGSQDNNWKPSSSAWNKSSSWDPSSGSKEVKESNNQGQGGWDNQGSGWSKGTDSGKQASTWNQSKAADEGPSSCRNESKDADGSGGGGNQDPWGKGSSTSWGQGSGSSKGGW